MTYLIFLAIGFGTMWLSRRANDDIPVIGTALSGAICLIWGFAIAPLPFQMAIEILAVIAIFFSCMRFCNCPPLE